MIEVIAFLLAAAFVFLVGCLILDSWDTILFWLGMAAVVIGGPISLLWLMT